MGFWCVKKIFLSCMVGALILAGNGVDARENLLQGSVSLGNDYDSNVFQNHTSHIDEWQTTVSPEMTLQSNGSNDSIVLEYAPDFSYNHRRYKETVVQNVSVSGDKALSSHWQINFTNNYSYFDNPFFESDVNLSVPEQFLRADTATQAEVVRILFPELTWDPEQHFTYVLSELQQRYTSAPTLQDQVNKLLLGGGPNARQRYWSNAISFESIFKLASKSALTVGYDFEVFDNKTGIQADRTEHSPNVSFSHQFTKQLGLEVGYLYREINLDSSDDSKTHNPNLRVDFKPSAKSALYLSYDFSTSNYEGVTTDFIDQTAKLGWGYNLGPQTKIDSSLSTSYWDRETGTDDRQVNLDLRLANHVDGGLVSVGGDCSFGETSIGSSWEKLSRSCEMSSDVKYDLTRELSTNFDVSLGRRLNWDINRAKNTYDDLKFGASLEYTFLRWFTLQFGYDYRLFDTNSGNLDDYNEHLVSIELSAAKELWRW